MFMQEHEQIIESSEIQENGLLNLRNKRIWNHPSIVTDSKT